MGWLLNYAYRKEITITGGTSGSQTDYQILLTVIKTTSMESDYKDIRFTEDDGITEINAWLESSNSTQAKIWVKFPTTPADGIKEAYYMYYNNPVATADWDIDGTFILGDDFVGQTSLDPTKWSAVVPPVVSGGNAEFAPGRDISSIAAYDFSQPVAVKYYLNVTGYGSGSTWEFRLIDRSSVAVDIGSDWYHNAGLYVYGVTNESWTGYQFYDITGSYITHTQSITSNDDYRWQCTGSRTFDESRNRVGNWPSATRYLHLATDTVRIIMYWIIVSKCVENPATYDFGAEEEAPISISVPRWNVYFDGNYQKGIQKVDVLNTIAGSAKSEIILSDVSNLNDIAHFADIEIWSGADDTIQCGLIFDGTDDYVELDNTVELTYNDFAISWWMKRDVRINSCIFCETKNGTEGFLGIYGSLDIIHFATPAVPNDMYYYTGLIVSDNDWHHYVFNSTDTITELYVDGLLADTNHVNTDTADFKVNFFGYDQSSPGGGYFEGSLAHVIIYDQAIDATEVDNLYSGFYTITPKTFWDLSQSTAQVNGLYDRRDFSHGTSYTAALTAGALSLDTSPLKQFIAFKGRIDLLLPDYDTDTLSITGRDYLSDLLSRAVVEDYTTRLRSYIVNDLVLKYGTSMSRNNIENSPAGTEISYLFKTDAWSAIVGCAAEDVYKFYCDTDKDFHYIPKGWNDSGVTLTVGSDDILTYNIIEQDSDVINRVIVYGYDDGVDQVIVQADDLDSQDAYGVINEKKLIDTELLTETAAEDFAYTYLADHSIVLEIIELDVIGNETLKPGDLIHLVIPDINIDSEHLIIDKILKYPSNITTIRVAKYAKNLERVLSSMIEKILSLESQFMDSGSDILKLFRVNEAVLYTDRIVVEKKPATTDGFIVGVSSKVGVDRVGSRGIGIWEEIYDSGY